MKKYFKEITILLIQMVLFYIYPLLSPDLNPMGMVFMIMLITFILSTIMGIMSKDKVKYIYPVVIAVLFIPSVFIYYNSTALVHSIWYLIISCIGLLVGITINKFINKK